MKKIISELLKSMVELSEGFKAYMNRGYYYSIDKMLETNPEVIEDVYGNVYLSGLKVDRELLKENRNCLIIKDKNITIINYYNKLIKKIVFTIYYSDDNGSRKEYCIYLSDGDFEIQRKCENPVIELEF